MSQTKNLPDVNPNPLKDKLYKPTKVLIQGDSTSFFWSFDTKLHYYCKNVWSSSRTHHPYPDLMKFYSTDAFNYDHVWLNHSGDYFTNNRFNANRALEITPSTLKGFFITQRIDTPLFLKPKRSYHKHFTHTNTKMLVGMLSKHGLHLKVSLNFFKVYNVLWRHFLSTQVKNLNTPSTISFVNWAFFYPLQIFNSPKYSFNEPNFHESAKRVKDAVPPTSIFNYQVADDFIHYDLNFLFNDLLYYQLKTYLPIFAMKFKKVDKLRYKHSRGKSGKYTVEWKYIPAYKRMNIVLRWLTDDIVLQKSPLFRTQVKKSLSLLLTAPNTTVVAKNRNYVHKYVYSRYKNSLLRTLKKI